MTVTVFIKSGTTWVVPADWDSSNNTVHCIGGGADNGSADQKIEPTSNNGYNGPTTDDRRLYASTTPGEITATQPSGTDDVIRVIGHIMTDDCIYFNPSPDYLVHI
jgi:hypothetical protein